MTKFDQPFPDYELLDRVGGGAMGTVFKARHKRLNRIVALKILKPSLARDKRYVDRLRREARIVASLSHPHIVTGYDLGEESGYHFFVMEFVEGKSLRQLLVEWGMFAEEYVLRVAREVAEALDHAYQRDVIHRDIKPANILIDESGSVKLTDMGLAKGPADLTLTRDGATVGTPMYISPEQARNPQDVDVRSDLYSLGATIYHMATGVPPFAGDTMAELITNVLNEDVVPPNEANSAVSAGLSLVIRKLLTKNLAVRYQTPRELLDDLDRLDQELPPSVDAARLEASVERRGRWLRLTVAVASAAALAVGAWWLGRQMVEPTQSAPSSEQFLAALDQELVALPSPGARFERLREVTEEPPGTVQELERRRVQVAAQLQATLDLVIGELEGPRRDALEAWLRDPLVWPDAAQFERERLLPSVRKSCGVELGPLPARIRRDRVDALRQSVAQSLERRDAELLARFDHYLSGAIAGQAISSARRGEFAGAAQSWAAARSTFCDGVGRPLPERLAAPLRDALDERLRSASQDALQSLAQAEQAVVRAMRGYVSTTLAAIQASMAERDAGPDLAAQSLRRLRTSLDHYWPRAASFRLGRDPWPEVEQQLNAAEQEIELRRDERRARRFEARCDTAWHVYVHGDADSALAVLDGAEPATSQQRRVLEGHVRCLRAAQRVEQAVYRAIAAQASRGPIAFRAGSAEPYALRVEPAGERLRLYGEAVDQPARAMRLTELRVGALLSDLGPLQAVASGPRQLGVAVLGLAADDGDGVGAAIEALPESDRGFVLDAVAPRLRRARGDRPRPTPVDVDSMFRMLDEALAEVDRGGSPRELTRALLRLESRPKLSLTSAQERRLRAAQQRRELVIREANLLADLRADAPRGARPTVRVEDGALVGSVSFPAAALRPGAGDGWQLREDVLEFAGGGRPFEELAQLGLRADPGERLLGKRTRLEFEAVFPGHVVGDRSYLLEFDGVSLVLVLGADDSVQVELVDGAALDEARARRAYATALTGVFAPARASAIPGAAHRVVVDVVQVAPSQASVKVTFEDRELLRELHGFDPKRRPRAALFPRQELGVRKLTISAFDL